MRITWEVEDGYVGKSRPQVTMVDDEDLESCESDEEREAMIEEAVRFDFEQKISWYIRSEE